MSYTLTRKTEDGYLHFKVIGENSPDTVAVNVRVFPGAAAARARLTAALAAGS